MEITQLKQVEKRGKKKNGKSKIDDVSGLETR